MLSHFSNAGLDRTIAQSSVSKSNKRWLVGRGIVDGLSRRLVTLSAQTEKRSLLAKKLLPAEYAVEVIEKRIYVVRGQRVMLDEDLAELYQVPTKVINQAMKRHPDRFPADFAFQLTLQEFTNLKSQSVTSSFTHGGRRKLPWVFTEQGVAMLSSVLRSPKAIRLNIEIMRAFIRLRRLLATPGELIAQLRQLSEMVNVHDGKIKAITDVIQKMLEPPPEPARGRFGFYMPEPGTDGTNKESK